MHIINWVFSYKWVCSFIYNTLLVLWPMLYYSSPKNSTFFFLSHIDLAPLFLTSIWIYSHNHVSLYRGNTNLSSLLLSVTAFINDSMIVGKHINYAVVLHTKVSARTLFGTHRSLRHNLCSPWVLRCHLWLLCFSFGHTSLILYNSCGVVPVGIL